MNTDVEILQLVRDAFADCKRPVHFTIYTHCDECQEHDDLLRSRDLESLTIADVGNAGWNPIPYATPPAFCYYLPALARLSLDEPDDFYGWYFGELLFFLTYEGAQNKHLQHCTQEQRRAIATLLQHVAQTRPKLVGDFYCEADLQEALALWTPTSA